MRRVVVTGLGAVTPLGATCTESWNNLIQSKSGITSLSGKEFAGLPSRIAGQVPSDFNFASYDYPNSDKYLEPFMRYGIAAAEQALQDAGWKDLTDAQKDSTGVCIGTGIGALDHINTTSLSFAQRKLSPYFIPRILPNLMASHVAIKNGFTGVNHCVSTACTTGSHAIGDASRFIQFGDADVIVCGASEACISQLGVSGFTRIKALSTAYNDDPSRASRPFDRDRDGFVIAEGAACVILEEYNHAVARGARIYAEVCGYGLSCDAFHYTSPPEDGRGAAKAMKRALQHSGLGNVDYINAHATSTPIGDAIENRAIVSVFGTDRTKAISSSKGATGHLLGAAGSVEAVFTVLAIYHNIAPPTLNLESVDAEFKLNYVPQVARDMRIDIGISNSFGFGGTNACLLFRKM